MASKHPSTSSRVIRTCGSACSRPTAQPSALARTGNKLMLRLRWNLHAARRIAASWPGTALHLKDKAAFVESERRTSLAAILSRDAQSNQSRYTLGKKFSEAGIHTSLASARQPSLSRPSVRFVRLDGRTGEGGTPTMSDPYPSRAQFELRYATELTTSGPLYSVTHTGLEIGQDEFDDRHARPSVGS